MQPDYAAGSAYHIARRWTNPHTVKCLETACDVLGKPTSLVDFGCAEGVTVKWAQTQGIEAMGVDLAVPEGDPALVRADLRERVDLGRQFAWVCNWETAEHLPEDAADRLCRTLVRHMAPDGRILFTAARPGQRGPGHITLKHPEWWMEKMFDAGVVYADDPTRTVARAWRKAAPAVPWYWRNLLVFWRLA